MIKHDVTAMIAVCLFSALVVIAWAMMTGTL
jgi:hypothetical protein